MKFDPVFYFSSFFFLCNLEWSVADWFIDQYTCIFATLIVLAHYLIRHFCLSLTISLTLMCDRMLINSSYCSYFELHFSFLRIYHLKMLFCSSLSPFSARPNVGRCHPPCLCDVFLHSLFSFLSDQVFFVRRKVRTS